MYKIKKILHYEKQYLLEELIKVFLRPDQYRLLDAEEPADADTILINEQGSQDKKRDQPADLQSAFPPDGKEACVGASSPASVL